MLTSSFWGMDSNPESSCHQASRFTSCRGAGIDKSHTERWVIQLIKSGQGRTLPHILREPWGQQWDRSCSAVMLVRIWGIWTNLNLQSPCQPSYFVLLVKEAGTVTGEIKQFLWRPPLTGAALIPVTLVSSSSFCLGSLHSQARCCSWDVSETSIWSFALTTLQSSLCLECFPCRQPHDLLPHLLQVFAGSNVAVSGHCISHGSVYPTLCIVLHGFIFLHGT